MKAFQPQAPQRVKKEFDKFYEKLDKVLSPDRKGHQNTWPAGRPINLSFVSLFAVAGVHLAEDRGGSRGQRLKSVLQTRPVLQNLADTKNFEEI